LEVILEVIGSADRLPLIKKGLSGKICVFAVENLAKNFFSDAKNMTGNHKKPAPRSHGEDRAMAAPFGGAI
jgi:hypothetical protein